MNDDEYKGIRVGVEVKLGEQMPFDDGLLTTMIIMTELKNRNPKAFKVALQAMHDMDEK